MTSGSGRQGERRLHDWFWAARDDAPAGNAFVIENGQTAMWRRVRAEIDAQEDVAWDAIHRGAEEPGLEHILGLLLTVVPSYQVSQNRFVFEAAKIPCFARFLRDAPENLSNYVSNSAYSDPIIPEPYTPEMTRKLGAIVSTTLGVDDDWYDA